MFKLKLVYRRLLMKMFVFVYCFCNYNVTLVCQKINFKIFFTKFWLILKKDTFYRKTLISY